MTSQEVLAPPTPPPHPVRRVLAAVLLVAVVGTAVVLKLTSGSEDPGPAPAAASPLPAPATAGSSDAEPVAAPGPLYPPTPLDGHWVSARLSPGAARAIIGTAPGQRLTLQIRSTALVLWVGSRAEPNQRIVGYESIYVEGHHVELSPVGYSQDKAFYRWRISHDRLSFALIRRSPQASPSARLVTLPFARRT